MKIVDIAEGRVELSKHKTMKEEPLRNGSYGAVFLNPPSKSSASEDKSQR